MKLINIVLIVILVVLVFTISSDKLTPHNVQLPPNSPDIDRTRGNILPTDNITATEEDILIENRGPAIKVDGDFPIPQTTTLSKNLSPNYSEDLSIITNGATLSASDTIPMVRSKELPTEESHVPYYYRKDNMSGSTIGTTEYSFAEVDNLKSSHAWSDENVSQLPGFYTSQVKDDITNTGAFFDINNNFVDTTKPRSSANVGDVCYTSKEGSKVCLNNKNINNTPPSLISDVSNCGFLNSVGLLEFSNIAKEDNERVNNGGYLYDQVTGSKKHNEVYSEPIKQPTLTCQI